MKGGPVGDRDYGVDIPEPAGTPASMKGGPVGDRDINRVFVGESG